MRPARLLLAAAFVATGVAVTPALATSPSASPSASPATSAASTADFFPGCTAPSATPALQVGRVDCLEIPSAALGGTTAFSYYIPPACAPGSGNRCPVFYELHGFGGSYTSMLGTGDDPSAYVSALASGPVHDPHNVPNPWAYSDPAHWVAKPSLDAILIAPDGRTVPGGFGPAAGLDGYWIDWNPKYASNGARPRYDTAPPRFEQQLLHELIPYVEATFPVGRGRDWRALVGESLGGYGSYTVGLRHPDLFASVSSVSGAMNFLFAPGIDSGTTPSAGGVTPPVQLPKQYVPAPQSRVPFADIPSPVQDFGVALLALGDPGADQGYFRGHMPRDLAPNARAFTGTGRLAIDLRAFSNDAVAHNPRDLADPSHYAGSQAFEAIVLPMNTDQRLAFADVGVPWNYELHPGTHSGEYWNAWYRDMYEGQYAVVRHWNGTGKPLAAPKSFDFRSTDASFSAWGWHFGVRRPTTEFLNLTNVSCHSITLRGTGSVSVQVPSACGTGLHGSRNFTVELGASYPVDEPANAGAVGGYGRTVTVTLA